MLSYLKNKLSPNELLSPQDQQQQQPDQAEEALHQEWRETAFNLIRQIRDPEKPETLEQLDVVQEELVEVLQPDDLDQDFLTLKVTFVPTVPHCSLATLIGLCIRTKLVRDLPPGMFKIDLAIKVRFLPLTFLSSVVKLNVIHFYSPLPGRFSLYR